MASINQLGIRKLEVYDTTARAIKISENSVNEIFVFWECS
jgi:hypothetical protein